VRLFVLREARKFVDGSFFEYVYYVGTSEMFKNFILGSVR